MDTKNNSTSKLQVTNIQIQSKIIQEPNNNDDYLDDLFNAYEKCKSEKIKKEINQLIIEAVAHEAVQKHQNETNTTDMIRKSSIEIAKMFISHNVDLDKFFE